MAHIRKQKSICFILRHLIPPGIKSTTCSARYAIVTFITVLVLSYLVLPHLPILLCTNINHASYKPLPYNEFWEMNPSSLASEITSDFERQITHRSPQSVKETIQNIQSVLTPFLNTIERIKIKAFDQILKDDDWTMKLKSVKVLSANEPGYFGNLKDYPHIHTVMLKIDPDVIGNSFPGHFYNHSSNDCDYLDSNSQVQHMEYGYRTCAKDPKLALLGRQLTLEDLRPGLAKDVRNTNLDITLTHLHIIRDAIATGFGDIFTQGLRIRPYRCGLSHTDLELKMEEVEEFYEEVFTTVTLWGHGYYHWIIESLPRIMPYVEFLKQNPNIRIHVLEINSFVMKTLQLLGLERNELVSGVIRAHVMYMPAGIPCGTASVFPTRLLSLCMRDAMVWTPEARRSILVVKRSTRRYFYCHDYVLNMLQKVCFNLIVFYKRVE